MGYSKPKILLIDLPAETAESLKSLGLNVSSGTYGTPYKNPAYDNPSLANYGYIPVFENDSLPNIHEQEIIIVDLTEPAPLANTAHALRPLPDAGQCVPDSTYIINPRYISKINSAPLINRLLQNSGVVIAFLSEYQSEEIYFYSRDKVRNQPQIQKTFRLNNWHICEYTDNEYIDEAYERGSEMTVTESGVLPKILTKYLKNCEFFSHLMPTYRLAFSPDHDSSNKPYFFPILKNKYDLVVGAMILWPNQEPGVLLLLPQFADKTALITELVRDWLPGFRPGLFPEHEGAGWVHRPEYEHPNVITHQEKIHQIQLDAEQQIAEVEARIAEERERLGFLHGLLNCTGDDLVSAAIQAFGHIGFTDVVNVDDQLEQGVNREEDIWIQDRSPTLLVEVKGLTSVPTETDTQQLTKYLNRRKSQWKRFDVQGVFLVNHQLGLPPLDRNNKNVFTAAQINDARNDGVCLLTTWDLFRLIRGMDRWSWPPHTVQDIFFRTGRCDALPSHWSRLGVVKHFYDKVKVASILLNGDVSLEVGDTVGYFFSEGYEQESIASLQIDKQAVPHAEPGQNPAYPTRLPRNKLPENTVVYLVGRGDVP